MESKVLVAFIAGGLAGTYVASYLFSWHNPRVRQQSGIADTTLALVASSPLRPPLLTQESDSSIITGDEILAEQFTRNLQFFGTAGQKRVSDAFVVVVGLGGVGSHCAHMLLRSGISRLRLVDFDQISLSSLNRHAVATREDVGTSKAGCLRRHFSKIYPEANLDCRTIMYDRSVEEELLGGSPDFVVDCIDNIDTKVDLLAACVRRSIPVLACGGAGAKCDPTRIRVVDLAESVVDPLARAVRHRLRREHGIKSGISVLLSTEKQKCDLVPIGRDERVSMKDYQIVPNFRVRTIPVFGALPAIFGMACAAHVVTCLAGQPFDSEPVFRIQTQQYDTQLERLRDREDNRQAEEGSMGVDLQDIVYLVKDVWHARSARAQGSEMSKGMWRSTAGLHLTRWDATRPACVDNLVLLTADEADEHDELMASEGSSAMTRMKELEPGFVEQVEEKFRRVRADFGL